MNAQNEVRLYNDFSLPLDPANLVSMSEYNLSLCIFQTIFIVDRASLPTSNVLDSYVFDDKSNSYLFRISSNIKWSDGKPLTAEDLGLSIKRLEKVAPGYYRGIESLLQQREPGKSSFEVVDTSSLRIYVKIAGSELFKRLTSAFTPIIRADMLDSSTLKVINHKVSLGPYVVQNVTKEQLSLQKNKLYFKSGTNMAEFVKMRPYPPTRVFADDLLKKDAWPNLILDRVFLTKSSWSKLKKAGDSFWTRPIDRVMLLTPLKSLEHGADGKDIIRWLASELKNSPLQFHDFPGVEQAKSLQPKGFVLAKDIEYPICPKPLFKKKRYSVAVINDQTPYQYIAEKLQLLGFEADYDVFPVAKAKETISSGKYDFIIKSFGAADPDPTTWLSLVFQSTPPMVPDFSDKYKKELDLIKKESGGAGVQAERLRNMLYNAGIEGLYLPLAHFSSIAVASKEISFEGIWDSDETIDISRLVMK